MFCFHENLSLLNNVLDRLQLDSLDFHADVKKTLRTIFLILQNSNLCNQDLS